MRMNRSHNPPALLLAATVASFAFAAPAWSADAKQPPNIVLILADDLGYGDVGCYGGSTVPTPAIDSLAHDGVRCTAGYVTAPVCGPSRMGLLTGSYQQRFGCQWNEDLWSTVRSKLQLPAAHASLPEALRAGGYVTGHLGKWNFPRETSSAFDEARDVMDWEGDYFPNETGHYIGVDNPDEHASGKVQGVWGPQRADDEYLTDRIGRHAVEFITKHKARPFFLYLAFNAVHSPWQAKTADRQRFGHITPPPLDYYAAMLASLDENIGRVLAALKANDLERNTLVVFTSDNGPAQGGPFIKGWRDDWPKSVLVGSAGGLRGHKAQFFEGGLREPFVLRWPAGLPAAKVYGQPVSTMDLYATCCDAAGVKPPQGTKLDGVSLLPYLRGENSGPPHETLFWKWGSQGAVRQGNWKLVISPWKPQRQLFNLADDESESRDLAGEKPELVEQLYSAWTRWSAPFPPQAGPKPESKAKPAKSK